MLHVCAHHEPICQGFVDLEAGKSACASMPGGGLKRFTRCTRERRRGFAPHDLALASPQGAPGLAGSHVAVNLIGDKVVEGALVNG